MFDYTKAEILAGVFLIIGMVAVGYLSISIGGLRILPQDTSVVSARFSNVGDLKTQAPVKIAGVTIGKVQSIKLADNLGEVTLAIDRKISLPDDTIASIATAGLLGDSYVSLSLGGSDRNLKDGSRITRTEPALNLGDVIGRYAFGNPTQATPSTPNREDKAAGNDRPGSGRRSDDEDADTGTRNETPPNASPRKERSR